MKNLILFLFALCGIFLMGCGHFSDGSSIWSHGTWIVPLIPFIGFVLFLRAAILSSKSNSTKNPAYGQGTGDGGNVPIWQLGLFYLAMGCLLVSIGIIIWQNLEK